MNYSSSISQSAKIVLWSWLTQGRALGLVLIGLFFVSTPQAFAQTPGDAGAESNAIAVVDGVEVIDLSHSITELRLDDSKAENTGVSVLRNMNRRRFPDSDAWLGVRLKNEMESPVERLFVLQTPTLTSSGFFGPLSEPLLINRALLVKSETMTVQKTSELSVEGRVVNVNLLPGEEVVLALLLSDEPNAASLLLWEEGAYARYSYFTLFSHGLLVGVLLLMGVLLLALRSFFGAPLCLPAGLFSIFSGLFLLFHFGYIWPYLSLAGIVKVSLADVMQALMIVMGMSLLLNVLSFRPRDAMLQKLIEMVQYASILAMIVVLFGVPASSSLMRVLVGLAILLTLVMVPLRLKGSRKDTKLIVPGAVFICLSALLAGGLMFTEGAVAIVSYEPFTYVLFTVGTLMVSFAAIIMAKAEAKAAGVLPSEASPLIVKSETLTDLSNMAVKPEEAPVAAPANVEPVVQVVHDERHELAMTAAREGLWDWDVEADRLHLSPYVSEMLGREWDLGTVNHDTWLKYIHPDDHAAYEDALSQYLGMGDVAFTLNFRLLHEDGAFIGAELRGACLSQTEDNPARCVGVLREVPLNDVIEPHTYDEVVSQTDFLTDLPDRDYFTDQVTLAISAFKRHGPPSEGLARPAILSIDIERIKEINEGLGQDSGDHLLVDIARRLGEVTNEGDVITRMGGGEFAVLTKLTADLSEATDLAEVIKDVLSQPLHVGETEVFPAPIIGISVCHDADQTAESLITEAQQALYEVRKEGSGNAKVYEPGMGIDRSQELTFESELRRALENYEMEVYYQPIMDLENGQIAGFESLIRWNHPTRGLLGPSQFVPRAEELGLIKALGRFSLSMTSLQLSQWQRFFNLETPLFASVNVSTKQLLDNDLVHDFEEVMRSVDLTPNSLKLEVTESQLIDNPDMAQGILESIRELGGGIVLDDFGTGHSSLERLKAFPFDTIKIDQSFVREIDDSDQSTVMVRSAIDLAKDLGMDVVAEGVETEDVGRRLFEMGSTYAQGYIFGAPMTAMEAQAFIANYWSE